MHLLAVLPPEGSDSASQWVRSSFFMKWTRSQAGVQAPVTFVCFGPLPTFWPIINRVYKSENWADVLLDPYLLVAMAFESWYQVVDESTWKILDQAREIEKVSSL